MTAVLRLGAAMLMSAMLMLSAAVIAAIEQPESAHYTAMGDD